MSFQLITSHNFNTIPAGIFNFNRYFFNEVEHLQHQKGENECYTFYWQNIENQIIVGRFSVIVKNKMAYSPLKATFGSIEFNEHLSGKELLEFLNQVIQYLKVLEIDYIEINSYPERYSSDYQNRILKNCFLTMKFQIKFTEKNFEIPITNIAFYEVVRGSTAKQLLRTFAKKGYIFQRELNANFDIIHHFIANSRERKNRPMTMNSEQLTEHFKKFSQNFQLFTVTHSSWIAAVGVTIKISEEILYTFYLADDEKYLRDSPTTLLLSGIYEYAKQLNFKILDVGIATEKGILNEGLAHYKQSLGAEISEKNVYFLWL